MIIDTHAHALDEAFLDALCRKPAFGLSAQRHSDGRFWIKRGDGAAHSLDENLFDIPRRIASLEGRGVGLQLIGPSPGFFAWPGAAGSCVQRDCRSVDLCAMIGAPALLPVGARSHVHALQFHV